MLRNHQNQPRASDTQEWARYTRAITFDPAQYSTPLPAPCGPTLTSSLALLSRLERLFALPAAAPPVTDCLAVQGPPLPLAYAYSLQASCCLLAL